MLRQPTSLLKAWEFVHVLASAQQTASYRSTVQFYSKTRGDADTDTDNNKRSFFPLSAALSLFRTLLQDGVGMGWPILLALSPDAENLEMASLLIASPAPRLVLRTVFWYTQPHLGRRASKLLFLRHIALQFSSIEILYTLGKRRGGGQARGQTRGQTRGREACSMSGHQQDKARAS